MTAVLGIDPGGPGGAVLLDGRGRLVWTVSWKANRRGWKLSTWTGGAVIDDQLAGRASAIGQHLADRVPGSVLLACEDVFVHRQRPNVRTTVSLARFGGAITAPIEAIAGTSADFVQAAVWRRSVLGLSPFTKRSDAKAAALRYIPAMVPGLGAALEALGPLDHLADAAGIALHRQRT